MAMYQTTFKLRRGYASTFTRNNTLLAQGEPAFELDTRKIKIGDGVTRWNELPYINDIQVLSKEVLNTITFIQEEQITKLFEEE